MLVSMFDSSRLLTALFEIKNIRNIKHASGAQNTHSEIAHACCVLQGQKVQQLAHEAP